MTRYNFYFNLREKGDGYHIGCTVYISSYQQNNYPVYQVGITFTKKDKKNPTVNNEKPSLVCYRPFMVVLFFTFKTYVNNLLT